MLSKQEVRNLEAFAARIRIETLKAMVAYGNGHIGGAMSMVDALAVLYGRVMNIDPQNPRMENRDRFVLSKGHAGPALYATLALKGYFPIEKLTTLNQNGTILPSHCDMTRTPGIDISTGSLGQGISTALGIAMASKITGVKYYTYVMLGDGECDEGQIWEGFLCGAHHKVSNLIAFVDNNQKQLDGDTKDICDLGDLLSKFNSFNWYTQQIDGHDVAAIHEAIENAKSQHVRPAVIILDTVKGKGSKLAEEAEWNHAMAFSTPELQYAITLTVMENIFLGQELTYGKVFLKRKEMREKAEELINLYHFSIHPDDLVENISIAKRQMVEILKSLLLNAKLIIMDEPTASMNTQESEILFGIIRNLKSQGKSIIYISHRLEEVHAMVDRLTVLRDGAVVGLLEKEEIDTTKVIRMMIGKNLDKCNRVVYDPQPNADVLQVENLCNAALLDNISFVAYGGQILGIGGLVGSGRTELLRSIFGLDEYTCGRITYNGKILGRNANEVMKHGVGLIPEDRRKEGFIQLRTITENVALINYHNLCNKLFINRRKEKQAGIDSIQTLSIRPNNPDMKCMNLSGGNQQKVVIGKWLQRDLKVLLVDEPTVGIDVGAKADIYEILRKLANRGVIVIMVSSDIEELLSISDRIIVLVDGHIFKDMRNECLTEDDILMASSGIDQEVAHEST